LASLAKRTSVAKSGEEAVPGDLNIERFAPDPEPLSSIAASSASQLKQNAFKLTIHPQGF
jgi:hypothetical protein